MKYGVMVGFLSLLLLAPANADEVEVSTGVICNTQKQMERFIALNDADPHSAIRAINAEEHDATACAVASLAFVRGSHAATVRKDDATFQIVPILVVGVVTPEGVRAIAPAVYFSLFRVDERSA
jgi:hypothetical protein